MSDNILFDESGLEAIRKSSPFDKFPLNSTKNSLTVQYTFSTNLTVALYQTFSASLIVIF